MGLDRCAHASDGRAVTRLLVSHPHASPFATGAAAGFEARGSLAAYVSGVVGAPGTAAGHALQWVGARSPAARNRLVDGVAPRHLRSLAPIELLARLAGKASARIGVSAVKPYDWLFTAHDAAVAALPWPRDLRAVYAYEDGALWTFRKARARQLARVWDLPLPHHRALEALWRREHARWPGAMGDAPPVEPLWKQRRKDEELALADVVSVASAWTRESLLGLGLRAPILVTPYGFPAEDFTLRAAPPTGPFTVLAVGTHDLRKGTPYLLTAWRHAGLRDARLRLIGGMRLRGDFVASLGATFEHVPHRAKRELVADYATADLLAFPTLGDGFGIVMQEAMCCGVPVLTTRCGGGPECVRHEDTGLLVPEANTDALVEALRWASAHRDELARMGRRARAHAERWTWREAGLALADAVLGQLR